MDAKSALEKASPAARQTIDRGMNLLKQSTQHINSPRADPSGGGDGHRALRQLATGQDKQQAPLSPTDDSKGKTASEKVAPTSDKPTQGADVKGPSAPAPTPSVSRGQSRGR